MSNRQQLQREMSAQGCPMNDEETLTQAGRLQRAPKRYYVVVINSCPNILYQHKSKLKTPEKFLTRDIRKNAAGLKYFGVITILPLLNVDTAKKYYTIKYT